MEIIKFRAWDIVEKRYWYSDKQSTELGDALSRWFTNPDRYKIQQFTGLKDKNGREIYKGDILKFAFSTKLKTGIIHYHKVMWNERKAKWSLERTDEKGKVHWIGLGKVDLNGHEIVGTVYENPELLGQKC
jgi:uncharacterized phage protein (TIGR01671 family)